MWFCGFSSPVQYTPHLNNLTLSLSHPSAGLSSSLRTKIIFCSFSLKVCGADLAAMMDCALPYGQQIQSQLTCNDFSQRSNQLYNNYCYTHLNFLSKRKELKQTIYRLIECDHKCPTVYRFWSHTAESTDYYIAEGLHNLNGLDKQSHAWASTQETISTP